MNLFLALLAFNFRTNNAHRNWLLTQKHKKWNEFIKEGWLNFLVKKNMPYISEINNLIVIYQRMLSIVHSVGLSGDLKCNTTYTVKIYTNKQKQKQWTQHNGT